MKFFFLLQLTILAALKLTRAKAQNIIYFFASVWYHWAFLVWRQAFEQAKRCGSSRHPVQAICYCSYPPRKRRAFIFVALIVKIRSCNNKKKFMVYLRNYFNCSTLAYLLKMWSTARGQFALKVNKTLSQFFCWKHDIYFRIPRRG
jgi:hypothetical protein